MTESVTPLSMDLEIPNNGDYCKTWALIDKASGASLLTGSDNLRMDIKATVDVNASIVLGLRNQTDTSVSGIVLDPSIASNGQFQITVRRDDILSLVTTGTKKITLYYDMGVIFPDGFFIVYVGGKFILDMGVTDYP